MARSVHDPSFWPACAHALNSVAAVSGAALCRENGGGQTAAQRAAMLVRKYSGMRIRPLAHGRAQLHNVWSALASHCQAYSFINFPARRCPLTRAQGTMQQHLNKNNFHGMATSMQARGCTMTCRSEGGWHTGRQGSSAARRMPRASAKPAGGTTGGWRSQAASTRAAAGPAPPPAHEGLPIGVSKQCAGPCQPAHVPQRAPQRK
jgi:hypothetical protein